MNRRRILALTKKNLKMMTREPAVLFMLIIFPLAMTFVFGLAFGGIGGGGTTSFDVGLLNQDVTSPQAEWSQAFVNNLTSSDVFVIHQFDDNVTGQDALLQGNLDAFIVIPEGFGVSVESYYGSPFDPSAWDNSTIGLYVDSGSMMAGLFKRLFLRQSLERTQLPLVCL